MGIPGLTTYVNNQSGIFYKDHALHDTVLLIDGNSLSSQIYVSLTVTNSAFGGDYERYKHSVQKFMTLLLSCNILPIVVFDGGYELRKLKTTVTRLRNTIRGVKSFNSINQQNNVKLFPIFMKEVFKEVTKRLHIPCVQSDLEADFDLVYLSRKFKCPVLSYDSDFYLNDVEYIPFYGIHRKGGTECETSSTDKALPCKIYRVEELFRHFGGLSKEFLPLLQCMLGNDYISHIHFKSFLSEINFRYSSSKKSPVSKRLAVLIKWCRGQRSLDTALAKIIENLKFHNKTEAIKLLKRSIVEYQTEVSILYPYVIKQIDKFKLNGKLEELRHMMKARERDESHGHNYTIASDNSDTKTDEINAVDNENSDDDDDNCFDNDDDEYVDDETDKGSSTVDEEVEISEEETSSNKLEIQCSKQINRDYLKIAWLVDAFRHGRLSNHVANIINLEKIYLLPIRENIKLNSVHEVSFDLLQVIGNLLLVDFHKEPCLRAYTRHLAKVKIVRLRCDDQSIQAMENDGLPINSNSNSTHCSIQTIPEYDAVYRRQLLMKYLKLSHLDESLFNGALFPEEWNLFIISLMYWCRTSPHVNRYHIQSLILSFIYLNILQTQCGYFESTGAFNRKYSRKLNAIKTEIQNEKIEKKRIKIAEKKKRRQFKSVNANEKNKEENVITSMKCEQNKNTYPVNNGVNVDSHHSETSVFKFVNTNTVNVNQLILLYEQLFPLSHLDEKLKSNHTVFGLDVIHTFCEYQSLFYFMNVLNSILKFPFQEMDMSKIYSGTFLYNVYIKMLNKPTSIAVLLEHGNEMFAVYNYILKFLEERTVSNVFNSNVKKVGRKKKKKRGKRESKIEEEQSEENSEDEDLLIDSDNIYSILQKVHI